MIKSLCIVSLIAVAGCSSSKTPEAAPPPPAYTPSPMQRNLMPAPGGMPQQHTDAAQPARKAKPANNIPANAQYTIYAGRVEGDSHVLRADRIKAELLDVTHMKDWYVVHEADKSLLYYGYYRSIEDDRDADTQRAITDRMKISLMTDPMGDRPFRTATLVPLAAGDPIAPAAWDLRNAPGDCTLQIAVYMGSVQRKQAAVDTVKAARAQGVEAYYFHGPTQSLVCVGHWPASAYRQEGQEVKTENSDPDQMVMAVPDIDDAKYKAHIDELKQQKNMQIVQSKVEILDPTLREMMMKFPRNSINGMEHKHTVKGQEIYDASQLVPIPHDKPVETATAGDTGGYDPSYRPNIPSERPMTVTAPPPQSGGHLRTLGE